MNREWFAIFWSVTVIASILVGNGSPGEVGWMVLCQTSNIIYIIKYRVLKAVPIIITTNCICAKISEVSGS